MFHSGRSRNVPFWELFGIHPGSFRKSGKQRSCGIRNLEEDTEDGRWNVGTSQRRNVQTSGQGERKEEKTDSAGLTGLAEVRSRNHDSRYHRLFYLSTTILVQFQKSQGICSKDFARRRKQRGRAHWGPAE